MTEFTDPIEKIDWWTEFGENRVYILWAVARRKHNEEITNATEVIYRKVIRDSDGIGKTYNDLTALVDQHSYEFRVYLTVNARKAREAGVALQEDIVESLNASLNGDDRSQFFKSVGSSWKSKLHEPERSADSYFQIDVDGDDEAAFALEDQLDEIGHHAATFPTPNGYHILTEPFDYTEWEPAAEYDALDTDGQVHIEEIDNS